ASEKDVVPFFRLPIRVKRGTTPFKQRSPVYLNRPRPALHHARIARGSLAAGFIGRSSTCSYTSAAAQAPAIGASQYAQCHCQYISSSAGPNERAGFIDAPLTAPPARMSNATVRPIPNPPILTARPRSSTAVPKIDVISKYVRMNSVSKTTPVEAHGAGNGRPSLVPTTASSGKIARQNPAAVVAPSS